MNAKFRRFRRHFFMQFRHDTTNQTSTNTNSGQQAKQLRVQRSSIPSQQMLSARVANNNIPMTQFTHQRNAI